MRQVTQIALGSDMRGVLAVAAGIVLGGVASWCFQRWTGAARSRRWLVDLLLDIAAVSCIWFASSGSKKSYWTAIGVGFAGMLVWFWSVMVKKRDAPSNVAAEMRKGLFRWLVVWATFFVIACAATVVMPSPTYLFAWSDVLEWAAFGVALTTIFFVSDFVKSQMDV